MAFVVFNFFSAKPRDWMGRTSYSASSGT